MTRGVRWGSASLGAFALLWFLSACPAAAGGLTAVQDLAADAEQAGRTGAPILLFFASDSCPYCRQVEELYLEPMEQRRTYAGRLLIRVVHADSSRPLRDFNGLRIDQESFARREHARFTPTIKLYAPDGRELAPPLVGYTSPDFYAGQLEQAIDDAILRLRETAARAAANAGRS